MHSIEIRSPVAGSDRDEVLALVEHVRGRTGADPISEQKVIGLKHGRQRATGFLLRDEGALVAYAHLESADGAFVCEVVAASPSPSAQRDDVVTSLLTAVKASVALEGGGRLSYFLVGPIDHDITLAEQLGFVVRRVILVLARASSPEDVAAADGPPLVPFRIGVDEDAWIELNRRAFATHPEQGRWSRSDLDDRKDEPWFSADGFLCCWIDGRLAGACWTKIHTDPEPVGEIYVMSIDPDFQGKGIGRRVLSHALAYLSTAGVAATILYVEGDNEPALGLYRSFGFKDSSRTVVADTTLSAL